MCVCVCEGRGGVPPNYYSSTFQLMATHFIGSNIAHRISSHNLVTTSLGFVTVHVSLAHQIAMCVCMCPGREGGAFFFLQSMSWD